MAPYKYDPGVNRWRHHWHFRYAGFRPDTKSGARGKCSCAITQEIAQALLDNAVPGTVLKGGHPAEFYAVYEGEVYVAVPTVLGQSYHGYPWRGDCNPNQFLPQKLIEALAACAAKAGDAKRFKVWMKKYHP